MKSGTTSRIYRGTPRNLALLAGKLRAGELVAVPTETVYGLAANALDKAACGKIFKAKGRPTTDPLIVHIRDYDQIGTIAVSNPVAEQLAKSYWPGPLTLILPKKSCVPDLVTAGMSSVAVRIPSHPLMRRLLRTCGLPLAAPSANPFGYVSPTTALHVKAGLNHKIGYILDGGPCKVGLESTIVDVRNPRKIRVLRPGAINVTDLSETIGLKVEAFKPKHSGHHIAQLAPGLLKRHYSPRAQVVLYPEIPPHLPGAIGPQEACLYFSKPDVTASRHIFWLCERNNQAEAARRLYDNLRNLDNQGFKVIHAELAPAGPLSVAINDRLRRAAAR